VTTLASALHLFTVRFLTGNFKAAFDLAPACVSDEPLMRFLGWLRPIDAAL
jgi:hypothetical protein